MRPMAAIFFGFLSHGVRGKRVRFPFGSRVVVGMSAGAKSARGCIPLAASWKGSETI